MRQTLAVLMLGCCAPALLAAQGKILPPAEQIALAVLPLPMEFRASAAVLGYNAAGKLVTLRAGTGPMVCLGDDPKQPNFHVACYHRSMEPFMARGRDLRAHGTKDPQVDTVRYAEVKSGKIPMPKEAALWSLTGPRTSVDVKNARVGKDVAALYEVYLPGATAASTGLPSSPQPAGPWLMDPGTPKAHIMFTMSMP
ncbi:MAG TPA: hypothetical protein VHW65_02870 [Gemmatimonadales bacterium]|jgi:hypothetical protein|nr:hypothetical protein [Gemmatimonadales bacterium]